MHELDFLYEQLKNQIVRESYLRYLNENTDDAYDSSEANDDVQNTMDDIEEAAEKKKTKFLDKRRKGVITAKKLLSKFKATDSKKRLYGLNTECTTFKSNEEVKKIHENAIAYLEQFSPDLASDVEVKMFISDIKDNVQYKGLQTIFGETCKKESCSKKTETKELTPKDVEEAVNFLENGIENYGHVFNREFPSTYHLSTGRKNASNYKTALMAVADSMYYEMMTEKLTLEFNQASKILALAEAYNPRDIKGSKEICESIEFAYKYTY